MRRWCLAWLMAMVVCGTAVGQDCNESIFNFESDHGFDSFISPMTNPVFFEDPRMLSEARVIFANHRLPDLLGGDNVQLYAMQIRARLTENLSFIATKDGFIVSQSPVLDDGWADLSAGLKLSLYTDPESQILLSTGFTFELPTGQNRALQGNGDGEFNLFLTGGAELFEGAHLVSAGGFRLPVDSNAENKLFYWSNHFDTQLGDSGIYLFNEWNWFHWMSNGNTAIPVGGLDLINLGSNSVNGQNVVTTALGLKYKPSANVEVGVAYEIPVTATEDIIQNRIGADLIFRY
ncbi:MAG: hypothetical protein R3C01_16645 [Planctomycetaceae bacterium]